jgi:surface polysaccharide O-acyltransferase-like enzyme
MTQAVAAGSRDARLDVLRIVATVAVVVIHVSGAVVAARASMRDLGWWVGNVADAMSRFAVPVFVMVTGSLLLGSPRQQTPAEFYRARFGKLLVPLVFWSVFYLCMRAYIDGRFDAERAVVRLATGTPHFHLWYLYMLAGLYVVTPFLKRLVQVSSHREILFLAVAGVSMAGVVLMADRLAGAQPPLFVSLFVPYIPYLLLGYLLVKRDLPIPSLHLWVAALACTAAIAIGLYLLVPSLDSRAWDLMYENLSPLVTILSVAVFLLGLRANVRSASWRAVVEALAPLTFGIYLIHPFWLMFLYKFGLSGETFHPLAGVPLTVAAALLLSGASVAVLVKIPFARAVVPV